MLRFSTLTRCRFLALLILLAWMPPPLALGQSKCQKHREQQRLREKLNREVEQIQKLKRYHSYPYFQLDVF